MPQQFEKKRGDKPQHVRIIQNAIINSKSHQNQTFQINLKSRKTKKQNARVKQNAKIKKEKDSKDQKCRIKE